MSHWKPLLLAAALASLAGCNPPSSSSQKPDQGTLTPTSTTAPATQASAPVNKICPVQGDPVDPTVTTVYQGKTIGFCCEDCIAKFKKEPEKYVKDMK